MPRSIRKQSRSGKLHAVRTRSCKGQYRGKCGVDLPDGCGGRITCAAAEQCADVAANCSSNGVPGVVGSCGCVLRNCSSPEYAGKCGTALDDGCGGKIICACSAGDAPACSATALGELGSCSCIPLSCNSTQYAGKCVRNATDGCGGFIDCGAAATCSSAREYRHQCARQVPDLCDGGSTFDCSCPFASDTCSLADATAAAAVGSCRGTDGACHNTPPLPASINTADRDAVAAAFVSNYLPYHACWSNQLLDGPYSRMCCLDQAFTASGSLKSCAPFQIPPGWQAEVAQLVNFFRLVAGVPAVEFSNAEMTTAALAAALAIAANRAVNATDLAAGGQCYSAAVADTISSSNTALGAGGARAVSAYMFGGGGGAARTTGTADDASLRHRRLLLNPATRVMASGDAFTFAPGDPDFNMWWPANALLAAPALQNMSGAVPDGLKFVAWPPAGFVPHLLAFPRWHVTLVKEVPAGFLDASVFVVAAAEGSQAGVEVVFRGADTLVFEPKLGTRDKLGYIAAPASDTTYTVTVRHPDTGVTYLTYSVTLFAPAGSESAQIDVPYGNASTVVRQLPPIQLGPAPMIP
ncbi:hypothetical protein OEZ86_004165 [Tetradesmus obliquus]|nr:hypothetical protein OEZ86_004165 [Tetradesmus obliquus]